MDIRCFFSSSYFRAGSQYFSPFSPPSHCCGRLDWVSTLLSLISISFPHLCSISVVFPGIYLTSRPFWPALGPAGLLDFVLRALRALRPCDPRIVCALAIYDAIFFGNGRTDGRTNKEILGVGYKSSNVALIPGQITCLL